MSLQETQERELELWKRWRAGSNTALPKLFESFRPVENAWYNKVSANNLPESAVRGRIKNLEYKAFQSFNPNKGVKLSTYVNSQMPKIYRYVSERQNIGRIPEHRALQITTFKAAKESLKDRYKRDPSAAELADELTWDLKQIEAMERDLRKDIIMGSALEEFSFHDRSPKQQVLQLLYFELDPREKVVFEDTAGYAGKKMKSTKEIAEKLGVSAPTVHNIKKKIAAKAERYL